MSNELVIPGCNSVWLTKNTGHPPANAAALGFQNDSGPMYPAVANTPYGRIPGKAQIDGCWYPLGGKEETTKDFWWLCSLDSVQLYRGSSPENPIPGGYEDKGTPAGIYYLAIADTPHGTIPGKVHPSKQSCWYSYDSGEHTTDKFSYVVLK